MYATFIDKGCYSTLCTKCVEHYVPYAAIDLFKKECLIEDVTQGMPVESRFFSKHKNIKNVGLIT